MVQISWPDTRTEGFNPDQEGFTGHFKEIEKSVTGTSITEDPLPSPDALAIDFKHDLHRGLKSRQIAMANPRKN